MGREKREEERDGGSNHKRLQCSEPMKIASSAVNMMQSANKPLDTLLSTRHFGTKCRPYIIKQVHPIHHLIMETTP